MMISVIIPVRNADSTLGRCLQALAEAAAHSDYECIVVDDGSTDDSAAIAEAYPVRVVKLSGGPRGPAYARNRGAEAARGDILFFIDADVVMHPDALTQIIDTFTRHPEADAVFGSYDSGPEGRDFLSRYKNLFHHFVHQQGDTDALTFWSGCGAVRRGVFLALGGFDELRYPRPSIEDIELGYRLRAAGHKIILNKELQVQHLKRWTLRAMITTDVLDRGIPWTMLALEAGRLPDTLNLHISQRVSAMLLSTVLVYLGLIAFFHHIILLPLIAGLFMLLVGTWSDGAPHYYLNRRAKMLAYLLIGVIGLLAVRSGEIRIPWLLIPMVFAMLIDRWLPHSNRLWQRTAFGVMVLALVTCVALLFQTYTVWLGAPVLLLALLIMLINRRFYVFFARQQGVLFMLAVVPFHFLYYLYSLVALAAGVGMHLLQPRRASSPRPIRPTPDDGATGGRSPEAAGAGSTTSMPVPVAPVQSISGLIEPSGRLSTP